MKSTILAIVLCGMLVISCNRKNTPKEEKESVKVDSMIQTDEQRADSMKRALGIE